MVLACTLAAGASIFPAFSFGKNKIAYNRFDWHVYKAPHFDIYYYPEEESKLEQVVSYAESAYVKLQQAFDHEIKFRIPMIFPWGIRTDQYHALLYPRVRRRFRRAHGEPDRPPGG